MKNIRRISFLLITLFTIGGSAIAQNPQKNHRVMDAKTRAEKMTEHMVKEFELNDTQKQQLSALNLAMTEKMGERPSQKPRQHMNHEKKEKAQNSSCCNEEGKECCKEQKECCKKENKVAGEKREKRALQTEYKDRRDIPKRSKEEIEKSRQKVKEIHTDYQAQLQQIFSPEQYQAYTKKQSQWEQKRKERIEKMGPNHSRKEKPSEKTGKTV